MAGLQPHPTGAPCAPIDVAIDLDASEPFLDDHRPGGDPLLGTAMGVELMSRAAHRMATGATDRQRTTEHVGVFEPLILRSKSATVHVRAVRLGDDAHAPIHCVVESRCRGGLPVPHFEASFVHAEPCIADTRLPAGVQLGAQPALNDADVYSLFFHGPAFRVIHSASSVGDGMLCEWRQDLPAWARGPVDPATADPRWVELCLQTAGLLEIATTQRMLIPHRIGSIEHIATTGHRRPRRLFAYARRAEAAEAIDIDLLDQDRNLLLRVGGYRTHPLPFPSDPAALAALAARFQRPCSNPLAQPTLPTP